ncbi:TRAP transporter small permease [Salmonella enterica subsp. enterica serovar Stanley]|uniref:TRAP transporter small permease protein n=1 Tax=Salmonella enterica subsp. enterica serovar Stanley TaxID=192953 RepID=A0A626Q3Q1_SALET|nr:TRAP transporter small permease [Salmonella enterica subsp. enterica serovar Stanley]EDB1721576.1 TRAP transporter small permease [Salmonella enterica subsp. enterica serovar Stanley]EEP9455235.1 TRAP transporter small permease [Salmonella enterica subsp. enterica serovar Stanley]
MRILTNALNKILAGCCCIILAIMVACVSWQVAARFIFNAPSSTLDEFTQILFMWMILLGGVYTAGLKKHLAIDLLAQKLSRTPALVLDSIIQVIITVFALIFMVYGGDIIVEKAAHVSQMSPVLKWPMDKVYWAMPISGVILVYYTIVNVIDNYHQRHLR